MAGTHNRRGLAADLDRRQQPGRTRSRRQLQLRYAMSLTRASGTEHGGLGFVWAVPRPAAVPAVSRPAVGAAVITQAAQGLNGQS